MANIFLRLRGSWALVAKSSGSVRLLSVSTFVHAIGLGIFITGSAVFFTRYSGLAATQVGVGLSLAGLVGFFASVPVGLAADRLGAKQVVAGCAFVSAALYLAYMFVHSFIVFLVVVALLAITERGSQGARQAMVGQIVPEASRVSTRAFLAVLFNIGASIGALVAGIVIQVDSAPVYVILVGGNAVALATVGTLTMLIRGGSAPAVFEKRRFGGALKDLPFLAVTGLQGVLSIHASIFAVGLPLWIFTATSAPRGIIGLLAVTNTVLCVLLQVRLSRGSETISGAARSASLAGVALLAACCAFAVSEGLGSAPASVALVVGVAALTLGELWASASGWGMAFALAPERAQGEYQSVFALGATAQDTVGPILMTAFVLTAGPVGWLVVGLIAVLSGALLRPVGLFAERSMAGVHDVDRTT
ncbi:MFS transporter [Rathayibacter tritici]|uniref:MFS transporter n=2 Tax=Rathayibacter tritici TaxID=33888 RepID=A0A160KTQ2_9MICO|nr:MFS transporter [Rathayibacter tritici]